MNSQICPKCQAFIRTARSALELIGTEGVSETERKIAVSELTNSMRILGNSLQYDLIPEVDS
jgi:uncharacterized protein YbbK (DUF523 family)